MARRLAMIWMGLGLLITAGAGRGPDQDAIFQQQLQNMKIQHNAELRQSPLIDPQHPSLPAASILSLGIEHGMLVLRTRLQDTPQVQQRRAKIGNQNDWSFVTVEGGATKKQQAVVPSFFILRRDNFSPDRIESFNLQQASGASINISLQEQMPGGMHVVTLQEQYPIPQAHFPGNCQLVIMKMTTGQPWQPMTWSSPNFSTLMLEHPAEVQEYLRPLFSQADAQGVLTPDRMLAFELFHDQWSADSATAAKVLTLVGDLAGGDFRSRTRAQKELAAMGRDAILVLIHLDRGKLVPEQNDRVDMLIAPYYPMPTAQADKLRTDPDFLADCLYSDDLTIRQSAFAQLRSVCRLPLRFDSAADTATRSAQISAVLTQVTAAKAPSPKP